MASPIALCANSLLLLTFSFDELVRHHPTVPLVCMWAIAMLSYHQDVKHPDYGFGTISQIFAVTSLIALAVFGFTRGEWWNFLIVPALSWFHIQFTKRWSARPGAWW